MIDSKAILKQLQHARDLAAKELARLEATIKAFGGSVSSARAKVNKGTGKTAKRRLSPQALRNIKRAQKKRWDDFHAKQAGKKQKAAA